MAIGMIFTNRHTVQVEKNLVWDYTFHHVDFCQQILSEKRSPTNPFKCVKHGNTKLPMIFSYVNSISHPTKYCQILYNLGGHPSLQGETELVGSFNPKNMLVFLKIISPIFGVNIKEYLKPPPREISFELVSRKCPAFSTS